MKRWALFLAPLALWAASGNTKTFTGIIWDNRCSDGVCATQCPISKTPKYTLQTETDAWVLSDQKTPAKYTGKKVVVTGRIAGNNKLKVISIVPAT
jgi:hypothetical protein